MAENKKGFVLYADQKSIFNKLTDGEAGKLIKHIFQYVNDENPTMDDRFLDLAFEPIKLQLKRDLKKWVVKTGTKSSSGSLGNLKRWNTDLYTDVVNGKIELEKALEIAKHRYAIKKSQTVANVAVNDTVNVTVTDTVKVTDISNKEIPKLNLIEQWFIDLPNSLEFEKVCMSLSAPKSKLLPYIALFRPSAALDYQNFVKFAEHFKRWVRIELEKAPVKSSGAKVDRD